MNITVTTRVLGSHQLKAKRHAAELLLSTGLGEGKVASGAVTQQNIDLLRSWGVDPDDARRFHETYVVAYLAGEIVGASRYFPDLNWAVQAIKSGSRPSDITMIATRPRLSHLAVVPDLRGQGIGTLLLKATEAEAHRDDNKMLWGFAEASVESGRKPTPTENEQLFSFYSGCGYSLGGDAGHPPVEIFGQPMASAHKRVGKFFWKVL